MYIFVVDITIVWEDSSPFSVLLLLLLFFHFRAQSAFVRFCFLICDIYHGLL